MNNKNQPDAVAISIWNPNAAANWSLLFSPVFGAWLHAKNWSVLGYEEKAKQSMYWVYGGIAVLILAILMPEKIGRAMGIGYLFGWYFSSAKHQVKHVKEKLNNTYQKKGWTMPICIAIAVLAAFVIVAGVLATNFDPDLQQESALSIQGTVQLNRKVIHIAYSERNL